MACRKINLTSDELARAFTAELAVKYPPVVSPEQLAELIGKSINTIYGWMSKGHFDGAYRKRGKHALFWRDRALIILFDGKDWPS